MTTRRSADPAIRLRGVRHNNLKNFDLDIPVGKLTVVTGLSGSGKSSLAFDTLFAEGQRRYIETFSPYARQFFDRMDKPQVDRVEGIPPAIAIEQRNSVRSTRSTVGTMTELCDYMKLLWPRVAQLHCQKCGQPVRKEPPHVVWEQLNAEFGSGNPELVITFTVPLSEKLSLRDSLDLIAKQGYQRVLVGSEIIRVDEAAAHPALRAPCSALTVVQDRVRLARSNRARFVEACEQAYHFGKGRLTIHPLGADSKPDKGMARPFSAGFHCAACDVDYREPTPALFSFNHPVGACPACKGFGRVISIDYHLAIPDRSKTLAEGCVKPWQVGHGLESQRDLMNFCQKRRVPTDVPFEQLPKPMQNWVIDGDEGYDSNDPAHSWPKQWYGVKGYFRWLESKAYKMHVRVLLSRYRAYTTCSACGGQRLKPEALLYQLAIGDGRSTEQKSNGDAGGTGMSGMSPFPRHLSSVSLAGFYALSVEQALALIESLAAKHFSRPNDPLGLALAEVRSRLRYLVEVGLGYLTLDRPTRTLSGGETERVNLTTCLGTRLVNTLFVLDEPSVGLHPRDTARLVRILQQLRDMGNTVVVVEHEASVIRAADQVVDLGPGQGEKGGEVIFRGPVTALLKSERSLTGQYLSGRRRVDPSPRRPVRIAAGEARSPEEATASVAIREASVPYRITADSEPALGVGNKGREEGGDSLSAPLPFAKRAKGGDDARTDGQFARSHGPAEGSPREGELSFTPTLRIANVSRHNLQNFSAEIPLGRFVALTGVSGSGKTTLVREVLLPALQARLRTEVSTAKASDRINADDAGNDDGSSRAGESPSTIEGWERLREVVLVDQSPLGKTPRSNPVVYLGAFDDVRELFAQTDLAKQRGLNASAFSFNSGVGQCERCRGAGFEKIEMQFLSDVFIRCPECNGRRYRGHILEVKLRGASAAAGRRDWSIADLLEATVDDAVEFLMNQIHLPAGRRALARLKLLQEVGLGYLRLGQPINTLSGGESQRLKLVSHLAESTATTSLMETGPAALASRNSVAEVRQWLAQRRAKKSEGTPDLATAKREDNAGGGSLNVPFRARGPFDHGEEKEAGETARRTPSFDPEGGQRSTSAHPPGIEPGRTLFLFDEPTTGLHFDDVRILLQVFQRLVNAGHSLLVIEHNLDVIQCADWVIDLGPEGGEGGGQVVACGTPEEIAACDTSHTGRFLSALTSARLQKP